MLNVQSITSPSTFTIRINSHYKLTADIENEVERLWLAEQERRGKAIFNGRIMSASTISHNGIDGCIVEYRHLIAQRARPELFDILRVQPVAVSGLLECSDGIIFGRRATSMIQDAGLWELVPSGGIDTSKISSVNLSIVEIDFLSQIFIELYQETGITSDSVSSIRPLCVIEDTDSHVFDIGIAIKSLLFRDEVLTTHRNSATKEYDEIKIIPRSELNEFIEKYGSQFVIVSTALIENFLATSTINYDTTC